MQNRTSLQKQILGLILGLYFFLFFFFLKNNFTVGESFLNPIISLITIIIEQFFPCFIFIPLFYKLDEGKLEKRLKVDSSVIISLIFLLSFIYSNLTVILFQALFVFTKYFVILIYLVIPVVFFALFYKIEINLMSSIKNNIFSNEKSSIIIKIIIFSCILRFPYFINGEIGVDTFKINTHINLFLNDGKIHFLQSILSIFELYPDSVVTSPIIMGSSFSFITQIPSYTSIFLITLYSGCMSSIFFYLLMDSPFFKQLLDENERKLSVILYISLPLLLKFTDWSITGRTIYFLILPCVLLIFFNYINKINLLTPLSILSWTIITLSLFLSHGMGRIIIIFLIILKFFFYLPNNKKFMSLFSKVKNSDKKFYRLGIFLFFSPYLLYIFFNNRSLLKEWVFTRTNLTSFINNAPMKFLYGFLFIFSARMTFSGVLFLTFIFIFPYLKLNLKSELKIILLGIFFVFPFFVHSMYFYQSLSLLMIIFAAILLNLIFNQFFIFFKKMIEARRTQKKTSKLFSNHPFFRENGIKQRIYTIFLMFLIIFSSFTTLGIQFYRSISDGHPVTSEITEMSNYLNSLNDSEVRIFSSGYILSYQISSYSEKTKCLPCYSETFISYFPEFKNNISTSAKNFSLNISSIIDLARNGRYSTDANYLMNLIYNQVYQYNLSLPVNNSEVKPIVDFLFEFEFDYLLTDSNFNWTLYSLFDEYNFISPVIRIGDLTLAKLQYSEIKNYFSIV